MSKSLPDWWDSDQGLSNNITNEQDEIYDIKFKKKQKVSKYKETESLTTQDSVIKELSGLLVYKDDVIERLEQKLANLEIIYEDTKSEAKHFKNEYSKMYSEISLLKDIISRLDNGPKKEVINSHLFLSEKAPQEVVDVVWKTLSKIYHPDTGGSDEKMKLINLERDRFYKERGWK